MAGCGGAWESSGSGATPVPEDRRCRAGLQDSEHFIVCCSESGTFLGLGTVTGSVAIYIAFSLQVTGWWAQPRGLFEVGILGLHLHRMCREDPGRAYRGQVFWG